MKVLEINKKDLEHNIKAIKEKVLKESPDVKIYAVVKGNGVGLDIIQYSKLLKENGIETLAVAQYEEAMKIRLAGIEGQVLLLSPVIDKKELKLLIENDITLTIGNLNELNLIKEIAKENEFENIKVHLKIDTGFGRYGLLYSELDSIQKVFETAENIEIEGIFTHFSKAIDEKTTKLQYNRFLEVIEFIKEKGYTVPLVHCSASSAFLKYPEMRCNAVRIGSLFQGRFQVANNLGLKKIGKFKTSIIEIKSVPKGHNISYGNTYKTKKETKLATIPVGYMDGLNNGKKRDDFRFLNNIIAILIEVKKLFKNNSLFAKINGESYKIVGRLGMYHAIIDITGNNNINIGDEVELDIVPLQTNDEIRREYI